jgi:LemA protein
MFIAIGIVVVLILVAILTYNSIVKANVGVDEAFSQIDVQLKRRADLIPNLVTTVQGYAAHEKSTLDAVVAARAKATSATGVADTAAADGMLTQALRGLLAVAEAYPDLKASANFLSLPEELSSTENKVAFARQFYNEQGSKKLTMTNPTPNNKSPWVNTTTLSFLTLKGTLLCG